MGRNKIMQDTAVLSVARQIFRERGHAASTRDIAQAAGISQAVLFQRFGSKDALFFRAMTPDPPDLEALFGPYPPADPFEDLLGIAERLAAYLRAFMPTLLKVLAFPGVQSERLQQWHAQLPFLPIADLLAERFRRMNADGLTAGGDPHACAVALLAQIHSLAFFEIVTTPHERKGREARVRTLVQILWQGLRPRTAGAPPASRAGARRSKKNG